MYGLRKMLLDEQQYLEDVLKKVQSQTEPYPEGKLRISKDKGYTRYYKYTDDHQNIYIPRDNKELAKKLAQKTYNLDVLKKVEKRLRQLKQITCDYSDQEIEKIFASLHEDRQALINPVVPTWEQKLKAWTEEVYTGKEFREDSLVIRSEKGERVRSKSEKILADYFYRNHIPYKYEKPLLLKGYGIIYPDFTFLSRKTGEEVYWEHEGMMDRPDYARSAVSKIMLYQKNGIYPGDRLILTFETEKTILDPRVMKGLVDQFWKMDDTH